MNSTEISSIPSNPNPVLPKLPPELVSTPNSMTHKSKLHPCLPWIFTVSAGKVTAISKCSLHADIIYSYCYFCSTKHYHFFPLGYKILNSGLPSRCSESFQHGRFNNHSFLTIRDLLATFPITPKSLNMVHKCSTTWPNLFLALYYNLPFSLVSACLVNMMCWCLHEILTDRAFHFLTTICLN